jgi:two-component system, NarL family, response regulator DevR
MASSRTQPALRPVIRVLIADDHAAIRSGLRRLLADQFDMEVVGEAGSAIATVAPAGSRPDVAIVDYHLGDRNGLWVARRLHQREPRPRVLIYSGFTDDAMAVAAIIAGADGLLAKSAVGTELCVAVRRLAAGEPYLPAVSPAVVDLMATRLEPSRQSILRMMVHGIEPTRIAAELGMCRRELESERDAIVATLTRGARPARGFKPGSSPLHYARRAPRARPRSAASSSPAANR